MVEPGLDLHEWETRWSELEDMVADDPAGALREMVRLVEEMLVERGFEVSDPVALEGEEPEIARPFLSAREAARLVDAGEANDEDVGNAIDDLRSVYEYLVADRAEP